MIVYHLSCGNAHGFDAWFRDSAACDEQLATAKVICPECGSRTVQKAIMSPRLNKGLNEPSRETPRVPAPSPDAAPGAGPVAGPVAAGEMIGALRELCRRIEQSADYVGGRFADEARKIHYGEVEQRDIYGETSAEEAARLKEEGVEFLGIPWIPRHDS